GKGDGTFQTALTIPAGPAFDPVADPADPIKDDESRPQALAVAPSNADLNGDGRADIVRADAVTHDVAALFGNGDGTFHVNPGESDTGATIPIDRLHDTVDPNAIAGLDTSAPGFFVNFYPVAVAVADLNGDGKLDLVVVSDVVAGAGVAPSVSTGEVTVLFN